MLPVAGLYPELTDNLPQDMVSVHLWVARRVHDDGIARWAAWVLDPLLEESARVFARTSAACGSGGAADTGSLTLHGVSRTQPFIKLVHVLDLALDVPVGKAVLFSESGALVKNLLEVAVLSMMTLSPCFSTSWANVH